MQWFIFVALILREIFNITDTNFENMKLHSNRGIAIVFLVILHLLGCLGLLKINQNFNTASMQDTANDHTNQMGDFITPMCFGRALPPNHSSHSMGVCGPP